MKLWNIDILLKILKTEQVHNVYSRINIHIHIYSSLEANNHCDDLEDDETTDSD